MVAGDQFFALSRYQASFCRQSPAIEYRRGAVDNSRQASSLKGLNLPPVLLSHQTTHPIFSRSTQSHYRPRKCGLLHPLHLHAASIGMMLFLMHFWQPTWVLGLLRCLG